MKTSTFSIIRVAAICVGMLSLIILSSCTSQPTEPATKVKIGDLYYALDTADMTATIISPWEYYYSPDDEYYVEDEYEYKYESGYENIIYWYDSQEYREAYRICSELTTIEVPASFNYNRNKYRVTGILDGAFASYQNLETIHVHKDNPCFCSVEGVLFNKDTTVLISFPQSKSGAYSIPATVNAINAHAFGGNKGLTTINIPNSVTSIGFCAFNYCSSLTSVTIPGSVTNIETGAFAHCSSLTSVMIGNGVPSIGNYAFQNCNSLLSVTLPNTVTSIGYRAFQGCCALSSIEIPDNVSSIELYAFELVPNITYHGKLGPSPWYARCINGYIDGDLVFSDEKKTHLCACLTSATGDIVIPESVTHIRWKAFTGCHNILSVTVPSSVIDVYDAFCHYVPNIIYHGTLDTSEWGAKGVNGFVEGNLVYSDDTRTELVACVTNAEDIVVPESVKRVRTSAFDHCDNVQSITWNAIHCAEVVDLEDDFFTAMFYESNNITSFVIGDKVERIPARLCCNMHKLQSVSIPNSVKSIGREAFYNCGGLKSVTIGSNVTTIDDDVFYCCDSLNSIHVAKDNAAYCSVDGILFNKDKTTLIRYPEDKHGAYRIPKSVTRIEKSAFGGCTGLTSVKIPEGITDIEDYTFHNCRNLRSVKLPNSLERIGASAFYNCRNLTSITIPENMTCFGKRSFADCNEISSVTWNAKNCADFKRSEDSPFDYNSSYSDSKITSFVFGEKVEHIPAYLCYNMHNLNSITIPTSVTSIGKEVFKNCKSLTSVVWNAKKCADFETDAYSPFFGSPVTSFVLGKEVQHIPANLCANLSDITSIIIPEGTTSIGNFAFWSCSNLTSVFIPESVEDLGYGTFCGCYEMKSIDVSEKNPNYCSVDGIVFNKDQTTLTHYRCGKGGNFSVPNSLTSIGPYAFSYSNIEFFTMINLNVEEIGSYAFLGCRNLTSIEFSPNLTRIGEGAFCNCSSIDSIELPNTLSVIADYAFYCCNSLQYVMIPESVTSIGSSAFYDADGLQTLTIPSNVKSIGAFAFSDCSNLKSITCMAQTPPDLGVEVLEMYSKPKYGAFLAIENEGSSIPLYVPAGSVNAYKKAEQWKDFKNILPIKD